MAHLEYDRTAIREHLASFGIEANEVLEDGICEDGYYTLLRNDQKTYAGKEFKPWPQGFDFEAFSYLIGPRIPRVPETRDWVTREEVRKIVLSILTEIEIAKINRRGN